VTARQLFRRRLQEMLALEEELANEVLPRLRDRVRATDLMWALDRHLRETDEHVLRLRRIIRLLDEPADERPIGDLAALDEILRSEHLELAGYTLLVHLAQALALDDDVVHLLRRNMGEEEFALEQAEHALVKLLAEKIESRPSS
jgi:ferritin-like metal-binding protein YciE